MFFIGLCNNEAKYDNTPHNIGKIFLIYLKQFCDEKLIHEETTIDQKYTLYIYSYSNLKIKILLLNGYINHSGVNLYTIKDKIKLENFNEEILAIYDDITLDTGIFKLFINKGTNQHNGIKNLKKYFNKFWKLRIGITKPKDQSVESFVLSNLENKIEVFNTVKNFTYYIMNNIIKNSQNYNEYRVLELLQNNINSYKG